MPTLIVLFNLKPGASVEQYEAWAKSTDLPIVRGLPSVASFEVFRAQGLLSGAPSPYAYVEIIEVRDMGQFRQDVAVDTMRKVAAEFREFADAPQFILTERI